MKKNIFKSIVLGLLSTSALSAMEYENNELTTGLSLDGRGMEALIPAVVLREMEEAIRLPVCELFDVAGGTSSGALIMAKTFSPRATTMTQLVEEFKHYGPEIFNPKPSTWMKDLGKEYFKSFKYPAGVLVGAGGYAINKYIGWGSARTAAHNQIHTNITSAFNPSQPHTNHAIDIAADHAFMFFSDNSLENVAQTMSEWDKTRNDVAFEKAQYDIAHQYGGKELAKDLGKGVLTAWVTQTIQFFSIKACEKGMISFDHWWNKTKPPVVARYEIQNMEAALHNIFESVGLKHSLKQILIPVTKKDGTVFLFDSAKARRKSKHNYFLKNVIQATMSHPEDFMRQQLFNISNTDSGKFQDGGRLKNNSTQAVYKKLKKLQPVKSNIFLLSLGIGEIEDKPNFPVSKWGMYTFPGGTCDACIPGNLGKAHYDIIDRLGSNYVRKQAEFSYPTIYREATQEMLDEYEQKGITLARELEDADIFRKLAENRADRQQTQLVDDEIEAFEELTGINLRRSPDHENEEEADDQSWREKEPAIESKKDK